jgi:uncharacterized protein (TIGR04255 family)
MNEDRTLTRNSIKNFILRVDLIKNESLDIPKIASMLSKRFDRAEKRQVSNLEIAFTKGSSSIKQQESFDYVLTSETKSISMVFSEIQSAFWIESSQYRNNSIYKEIMELVANDIIGTCGEVESKRIGLRYINEFKCENPKSIISIFGKRLSSIVKQMAAKTNTSRIIGMEEYNDEGYKIRLQYGVPNKFYPSLITVYDLLLDIDSYIENSNNIKEWINIISKLNHAAYDKFIEEINPKYLQELK